jgi:aspartate aminotransferase-like enzyme
MQRFETNLRIPGPTSLPPAVREAGSRQMINHRGPEFAAMMGRIEAGLRPYFGTANDIVLLTAAGTGVLEAAIVNTLSPGDPVLAVSIGAFGDRFAKIAEVYGAAVTRLEVEWGRAAQPDELRAFLAGGPPPGAPPAGAPPGAPPPGAPPGGYRAILLTHNETSTGVTNPIPELAAVAHELAPDALLLVDGISGLGAVPFEQDAWGIDVLVSGSQKSWMAPPGMSFLSASERAWAAAETARMPRFYLDIRRARTSAATGETPWTPAVGVIFQLDAALELIAAEGPQAVFARHATCAAGIRAGLVALGFDLVADPRYASATVTAAWLPDELPWKALNAELMTRGLVIAGGQGKLKGRIIRVGHLGDVDPDRVLATVAVLEEAAIVLGRPIEPGSGIAAAQRSMVASQGLAPTPAPA